jgi:hypothetical protein
VCVSIHIWMYIRFCVYTFVYYIICVRICMYVCILCYTCVYICSVIEDEDDDRMSLHDVEVICCVGVDSNLARSVAMLPQAPAGRTANGD